MARLNKIQSEGSTFYKDTRTGAVYGSRREYRNGTYVGTTMLDQHSTGVFIKLFGGILIFFMIFMIFDTLTGSSSAISSMTAESFVQKLGNVAEFHIPTDWISGITLTGVLSEEWTILDGLRTFLITIVDFFRFSIQMSVGLANVFAFVIGLFGMFFTL